MPLPQPGKGLNKAWLAGFFDGEGSLWISPNGSKIGTMCAHGSISQAHAVILEEIQKEYGGTITTWISKVNGKTVGQLQFRNSKWILKLLNDIYPYLKIKKIQAELMLSFLNTSWRQIGKLGGARKKLTDEENEVDKMFQTSLKVAKPRYWENYSDIRDDDQLVKYVFEKVCELHPN